MGVISWNDPTTPDIQSAASAFARSLPKITPYLFNPASARAAYIVGGASVATWKTGVETLVLATNTYYVNQTISWEALGLEGIGAAMVFVSGFVEAAHGGFVLGPLSSGAFVFVD